MTRHMLSPLLLLRTNQNLPEQHSVVSSYETFQPDLKVLFLILLPILLFLTMNNALASSTGGSMLPYETWLSDFQKSLTGPVAFTVSLIGIVASGITLILAGGEIKGFIRTMVYLVLVMTLLIGANSLMTNFFNGASIPLSAPTATAASTGCNDENSGTGGNGGTGIGRSGARSICRNTNCNYGTNTRMEFYVTDTTMSTRNMPAQVNTAVRVDATAPVDMAAPGNAVDFRGAPHPDVYTQEQLEPAPQGSLSQNTCPQSRTSPENTHPMLSGSHGPALNRAEQVLRQAVTRIVPESVVNIITSDPACR